jgi:hypothetical protein
VRPVPAGGMLSRVTSQDSGELARAAARNNADWCAAVCQTHGILGMVGDRAWTSQRRTPPYYPDAVTLQPDTTTIDVLPRIDTASPGCSVKDSFATLDLGPAGFAILFDAQWIYRPANFPAPPTRGMRTEHVRTPECLRDWQLAWHGANEPPNIFQPALLDNPDIRIVAIHDDGQLTGGGALNLSAGMLGVTNMFSTPNADPIAIWSSLLTMAIDHYPGVPIVGYHRQTDLAGAVQVGFRAIGPLRVWMARS